jgi:hypothetical protein
VAVAQVDERENAKVALLRHPAHQHHALAHVRFPQLTASMRPFQSAKYVQHKNLLPAKYAKNFYRE